MSAVTQGLNEVHLQRDVAQPRVQDPFPNGLQGKNILDIRQANILFEQSQEHIRRGIEGLRMSYVFTDEAVTQFLSKHRAFPGVLRDAVEPLRECFGVDKVFRLEVLRDEDGLSTFYVVVRWTGAPEEASAAIDRFDDGWWLKHMTPAVANLSFTYDLV
jgi:hypothetical protein